MKSIDRVAHRWAALCTKAARALAAATLACAGISALAHDFKAGALVIDHPYATPTAPGARTGACLLYTSRCV